MLRRIAAGLSAALAWRGQLQQVDHVFAFPAALADHHHADRRVACRQARHQARLIHPAIHPR